MTLQRKRKFLFPVPGGAPQGPHGYPLMSAIAVDQARQLADDDDGDTCSAFGGKASVLSSWHLPGVARVVEHRLGVFDKKHPK